MADIFSPTFAVQGQTGAQWQPAFTVGETVNFNLACYDPVTLNPLNLSGTSIIWTMGATGGKILISRQATITNASQGLCYVPIASGDTAATGAVVPPGQYAVDCWAEDGSGNRLTLFSGSMPLLPAVRLPNSTVNPLPGQLPVNGLTISLTALQTANYTAALGQLVQCDPTSASFTVTLPAASSSTTGGLLYVVNKTSNGNTVTVARAGSDTIGHTGLTTYALASGEKVQLFSDGVSNWLVLN